MSDDRVYTAPNPAAEREAERVPAGLGNRALWFAVLASPAAWSADSLASIALHQDYCAALGGHEFRPFGGIVAMLTAVGVLMLALALAGGLVAWRAHGASGDALGTGETATDRRRFMAAFGLAGCALFTFAIVLRVITVFFIPASWCGR